MSPVLINCFRRYDDIYNSISSLSRLRSPSTIVWNTDQFHISKHHARTLFCGHPAALRYLVRAVRCTVSQQVPVRGRICACSLAESPLEWRDSVRPYDAAFVVVLLNRRCYHALHRYRSNPSSGIWLRPSSPCTGLSVLRSTWYPAGRCDRLRYHV